MYGDMRQRRRFIVRGRVQGVGFRPFVWRLAVSLGLGGHVSNCPAGVSIEVEGPGHAVAEFAARLRSDAPPQARIRDIGVCTLEPLGAESAFAIAGSSMAGRNDALPGPDVGPCQACLDDMRDPSGRRFGHAFVNCTDCGPRFSIARAVPYDRSSTSMSCFCMCAECAAEYGDPADRRFHAQPIACTACGPRLWYAGNGAVPPGSCPSGADAIAAAVDCLRGGGIVALKGVGGFQLACDARNTESVLELRRRKRRPSRALAVMLPNLEAARGACLLSPVHEELLQSPERPIVLCQPKPGNGLSRFIAPDVSTLGVMLPGAPLHVALFDRLAVPGQTAAPCLVMTSGNSAGEPICAGNREALKRLRGIADGWLMHDRDIVARVDDSVVGLAGAGAVFFRRARGYVPEPVGMPPARSIAGQCVFAAGAQLKAAFCLTRENLAYMSQHIGDLDDAASQDFYREALDHMLSLLRAMPQAVVCDLHPDYASSRFARQLVAELSLPLFRLQHHAAHAVSVLAENGLCGPALALALDGSGLGPDGSVWGGELLRVSICDASWQRIGCLRPFALPGGDAAVREPWRIGLGMLDSIGLPPPPEWRNYPAFTPVRSMLARGFNCPDTSSCGRLFDAVSALLGLCREVEYEGQAAMLLEKAARCAGGAGGQIWPVRLLERNGLHMLDSLDLVRRACLALRAGRPVAEIAMSFHCSLADGLAALVQAVAGGKRGLAIGLSGGVMQNGLLAGFLQEELCRRGFVPFVNAQVPAGDGGLAYGQAVWGAALLGRGTGLPGD